MRIETIDETKVVGLSTRFISIVSSDAPSEATAIPALWQEFYQRADELAERSSAAALGVTVPLPSQEISHPDERLYLAGAEVDSFASVPSGMNTLVIPAGDYAVFTHEGPVETLHLTMRSIYREQIPASGRRIRHAPHLEVYGERFRPGEVDSAFEIWVPV